jgi:hypothetical protein
MITVLLKSLDIELRMLKFDMLLEGAFGSVISAASLNLAVILSFYLLCGSPDSFFAIRI